MIDFSQVASIQRYKLTIPYAQCFFKYLDYQGAGMKKPVCLWKRPLSYPAMGFLVYYCNQDDMLNPNGIPEQFSSWALIDRYGIVQIIQPSTKKKIVEAGIAYSYPFWSSQPEHNISTTLWIYVLVDGNIEDYYGTGYDGQGSVMFRNTFNNDVKLTAYIIDADPQQGEYTPGEAKLHPQNSMSWLFSDVTTKKILLYARPDLPYPAQNPYTNSTWGPGSIRQDALHHDFWLETVPHSTDVVVDAGEPLVTLLPMSGSEEIAAGGAIRRIKVRTNLDDYKAKYDAATSGKFPKSQYPYLRAVINLEIHSNRFGIQNSDCPHWDTMYLVFETKR